MLILYDCVNMAGLIKSRNTDLTRACGNIVDIVEVEVTVCEAIFRRATVSILQHIPREMRRNRVIRRGHRLIDEIIGYCK